MAYVHLPPTLPPLFPGLPRKLELEARTVADAVAQLEERWPGLRDRLLDRGAFRSHIKVFVQGERAGLDTPLEGDARVDVVAAISGG